ncbi:MAG: hypothetical protein IT353_07170, partial [Gemmatimonadaceae bacterium]|nr:hypothetical protein [Gemmatimonadaceae bacterium]
MRSPSLPLSRVGRATLARAAWVAPFALLVGATSVDAQESSIPAYTRVTRWTPPPAPAGKKTITQDTYDEWRTISGSALSNDGKWAAYTQSPVVGEGELVVRATTGSTEYRVPRGYTGRPNLVAGSSGPGFSVQAAQFNAGNGYVVFMVYPTRAEVDRARARRGAPAPRSAMGIMTLAGGAVTRVPSVRSFQMAKNGGRFVAYLLEDSAAARAGGAAGAAGAAGAPARDTTRPAGARRETGNTLVLRELASGTEVRVEGVTEFAFDENEQWLGYTVSSRDSSSDGAYVRALSTGTVTTLLGGKATYRSLAFDRKGTQAVFVSSLG